LDFRKVKTLIVKDPLLDFDKLGGFLFDQKMLVASTFTAISPT
jgi:hypothetical protein